MLTDEEKRYIHAHAAHLQKKLQQATGKNLLVTVTEGNSVTRILTRDTILSVVASVMNTPVESFLSKNRHSSNVDARCIAIQLLRNHTAMSTTAIGRVFRRDHSTVINMLRQFEMRMRFSPGFKKDYDLAEQKIKSFLKQNHHD